MFEREREREHKVALTSYRDCLSERKSIPKNSGDAYVLAIVQYELRIESDETKQARRLLLQRFDFCYLRKTKILVF